VQDDIYRQGGAQGASEGQRDPHVMPHTKKKTSWEGTAHGVVCMLLLKMGEACFNNFTTIKDRQSFYPLFCFVVVLQNCVALHRQ